MDIDCLLAEIAHAHLLRWHCAQSQVGVMLAVGHKYQVTVSLQEQPVESSKQLPSQDSLSPSNTSALPSFSLGFLLQVTA